MTVTQRTAQSLTEFMDDPINFFGQSYTQMHSIDRDELESLQRQAMAIRFQQHYQSIEMLRKLADRLGITAVDEFDDVVPLFFSHTAFKSYPAALIDKKRFDLMTKWLDKLTSYDLSAVDATDCTGIDAWIDRLDAQTPLEVITSSGTTGTISILPKDKHGAEDGMVLWKICLFQTFGHEPTDEQLNPSVDVVWPNFADGKLRPFAYRQHDQARLHRRRRIQISCALPVRGRHRSDVPCVQDAGGEPSRGGSTDWRSTRPWPPAKTNSSPCRHGRLRTWMRSSSASPNNCAASGYSCSAPTT